MPHQHHLPDMQRLENAKTATEQTYTSLWHLHPYGHRDAPATLALKRAAHDHDRTTLDLANARLALPALTPPYPKPPNFSHHLRLRLHRHPARRTVTFDHHHHPPSAPHARPEKSFRRSHPTYRPSGRFSAHALNYPFLNTSDPYAEDPAARAPDAVICASLDAFRLRCPRHGRTFPRDGQCPGCYPEMQARLAPAPVHANRDVRPRKGCLKVRSESGEKEKALPPTPRPAVVVEKPLPLLRQRSSAQALREWQAGKQRGRPVPEVQAEFLQPRAPHLHRHASLPAIGLLQVDTGSLARESSRDGELLSPLEREHRHHHHRQHRCSSPAPTPGHDHGAQEREREEGVQRGRESLRRGLEVPQRHRSAWEGERSVQRGRELLRRGLGM